MSHFSVVVIGANPEEQLAPFHEFECTGKNDQYVRDIDETEERRAEYESQTNDRYKDPEGNLHYPYDPQFYREPTEEELKNHGHNGRLMGSGCGGGISWSSRDWEDGKGYRGKVHFMPEGWEEVTINYKDEHTFDEYIKDYCEIAVVPFGTEPILGTGVRGEDAPHKYGYALVDENGNIVKVVNRTNPNHKWDWYEIGGRWTGFFQTKNNNGIGTVGKPGLMTERAKPGRVDQTIKANIDFEAMRQEKETDAAALYDRVMAVIGHLPAHRSWKDDILEKEFVTEGRDAAIKLYRSQERVVAMDQCEDSDLRWIDLDDFTCTREEYIKRCGDHAAVPFALVMDSVWYEKGEMGWFGMASNEMDQDEWNRKVTELYAELPNDTLITMVDCHI